MSVWYKFIQVDSKAMEKQAHVANVKRFADMLPQLEEDEQDEAESGCGDYYRDFSLDKELHILQQKCLAKEREVLLCELALARACKKKLESL